MKLHSEEKLLIVALLVCGIVMMIGTSFAYFAGGAVNVKGNGGTTDADTATGFTNVVYDAGTESINLENAYPSKFQEKGFTVKMSPSGASSTLTYAVKLKIESDGNTFVKCTDASQCDVNAEELVYTLVDVDNSEAVLASGDLTGVTGDIVILKQTKTITAETTFNYKLKIEFKDTMANQNHNVGKSFEGALKVEFADAD